MIDKDNIIYQAKISGYHIYYDGCFISVFDDDASAKEVQCLSQFKANCNTIKEFELETIYILSNLSRL